MTSSKRRGLGKGLGALIPGAERPPGLIEVPLDAIVPNPLQPRQSQDSEALQELADSIREHGILQPLIVTALAEPEGEAEYRLIAGERRWRAARLAGLDRVPVLVKEASPGETLQLGLVENIQRADLNPLEEAAAYQQLIDEFGLTQEMVAERVGRSRVAVANALRLLRLPQKVKAALGSGEISEGHARALLGLEGTEDQIEALEIVLKRGLSVRQTEELVRHWTKRDTSTKETSTSLVTPALRALEDRFRSALGTKVNLIRGKQGGRLIIHFYSEEELQALYDKIVGVE
ncbi:MAG: ParB/RepB/Spo0J family partition protein [Chloroflexi bacterium]|nr:ParB/RepB/Spo0J family partition protein [Chloroflexota bacterium]